MASLKSATEILDNQGQWQWGKRDCIATIQDLWRPLTGDVKCPAVWRKHKTETKAVAYAVKKYGSVGNAYVDFFKQYPQVKQVDTTPKDVLDVFQIKPRDVCLFESDNNGITIMAFVDNSYEFCAWNVETGRIGRFERAVNHELTSVWRCLRKQ